VITVKRFEVPFVSGAFLLRDVLSPGECAQLIAAAECVGYMPDEPLNGTRSVLAHNFVWLADRPLLDELLERVRAHLPAQLDGVSVAGLNANWRLFRYRPGAEYRPHIDGSWPGSGLVDGEWRFDAHQGQCWSKLTFLVYLSDEFDGGCTTFFTPSAVAGRLNARGVKPRAGAVLCFPHGNSAGALLHEGTGVTSGTKYIIRGDVLYYKEK
jgi:2OG-Fe(II) oxygenase superfamily